MLHLLMGALVGILSGFLATAIVARRGDTALQTDTPLRRELEHLRTELAVQSVHDSLTGLPNRWEALRLLNAALWRARRNGGTVGVLFIDLDGFKTVNDTHGHRYGDEVLRRAASRMWRQVREGDEIGRLGGDEFMICVEDVADVEDLVILANRIIQAVAKPIVVTDDITVNVGASIGISSAGEGVSITGEALLHEADLASYHAKTAGKGRAHVFSTSARAEMQQHLDLEAALERALLEDELVVHYQPIVDVRSGSIDSYEALVRWNRPGFGLVPPAAFLSVAEASDLICDLDAWVLDRATKQVAIWNARGSRNVTVSVNISGRHVSQPRVVDEVRAALATNRVDPRHLVVEVTETVLMDDVVAIANLEALRDLGVTISLDDFGTGYHSTTQLARLPIDILKIDRHFLDPTSDSARSLLRLMVHTAHTLGLEVTVEGVETEAHLSVLRDVSCEHAQGYHLGRPMPAEEIDGYEQTRATADV